MSDPLKVKVEGPLAPPASEFPEVLGASGYATEFRCAAFAADREFIGADAHQWLDVHDLSPSAIEGFFGQRQRTHGRFRTPRALAPFISWDCASAITPPLDAANRSAERKAASQFWCKSAGAGWC